MAMQTDVKSVEKTTSGTVYGDRTRVKGVAISYAANGTVVLKDGGTGGVARLSFTAPNAAGSIYMPIPGEGVVFNTDVYAALTNATATVFYG